LGIFSVHFVGVGIVTQLTPYYVKCLKFFCHLPPTYDTYGKSEMREEIPILSLYTDSLHIFLT